MNLRHSAVGLLKTSQQTNFINTAIGLNNVGKGFFLSPIFIQIFTKGHAMLAFVFQESALFVLSVFWQTLPWKFQ